MDRCGRRPFPPLSLASRHGSPWGRAKVRHRSIGPSHVTGRPLAPGALGAFRQLPFPPPPPSRAALAPPLYPLPLLSSARQPLFKAETRTRQALRSRSTARSLSPLLRERPEACKLQDIGCDDTRTVVSSAIDAPSGGSVDPDRVRIPTRADSFTPDKISSNGSCGGCQPTYLPRYLPKVYPPRAPVARFFDMADSTSLRAERWTPMPPVLAQGRPQELP